MSRAEQSFACHRSLAPMRWVLARLPLVELSVAHLRGALLWGRGVALILSIVTAGASAWLVGAIRWFRRLPVLVGRQRVVLRVARIRSIAIHRAAIAGLRGDISAAGAMRGDVLKLPLVARPNGVADPAVPDACGRGRQARAFASARRYGRLRRRAGLRLHPVA